MRCSYGTSARLLQALRPLADSAAVALVLAPVDAACSGPRLRISLQAEGPATALGHAELDRITQGIPAARALPLLAALASGQAASVVVEGLPGHSLLIEVLP